jgi:hypothetical protein
MAREGEIEQSILIRLIESSKTSLEDKVVEEFMHSQHASTAINQRFHLHQTELI